MGAESLMSGYLSSLLGPGITATRQFNPLPNLLTGANQKTGEAKQSAEKSTPNHIIASEKACEGLEPKPNTYTEDVSLAEKINEILSLLGKKVDSKEYQQLEFNFSYTSSEDIFFKFVRSTADQAGKLSSTQSETFLQIRQKIAVQFKIGGSIETESLIGFQKASEALSKFGDTFNKLLQITNNLLGSGNFQDLNEFLQQLSGIFKNIEDNEKFKEFIDKFLNQWMEKLIPGFQNGNADSQNLSINSVNASRISFSFQMEFKFEMSLEIQLAVQRLDQQQDPIVVDLDGDGIELTSVEDGVHFDITGTGKPVQTAWIKGGDAFLARDINGNGKIDSGLELFGDQWGAKNGFEELKKLDSNNDGFIGPEDKYYQQLILWRDNGDGVSTSDELLTLQQAGIERIALNYKNTKILTDTNNIITQKSFFIKKDNTVGRVADVLLNYKA